MNWYNNPRNVLNIANVAAQQRQIFVRSYDELVNAISRIQASATNQTLNNSYLGAELLITDQIIVSDTIVIPRELSGCKITSTGRVNIRPADGFSGDCFNIKASGVLIEGLFAGTKSTDYTNPGNWFSNFVKVEDGAFGVQFVFDPVIVSNCFVVADTLFRSTRTSAQCFHILHNRHIRYGTTTDAIAITGDPTSHHLIEGNRLDGHIDCYGEYNRIIGNALNGYNITTTGGVSGNCYVVANTRVGVGTYNGSDVVL